MMKVSWRRKTVEVRALASSLLVVGVVYHIAIALSEEQR